MSAKNERGSHSLSKLALYDALIGMVPGVERKGATMPYTSVNGHMFSYIGKDGVFALRLPKESREEFLARFNSTLREIYDVVQEEYVVVPDNLLANTDELWPYFDVSHQYVKGLKPIPSKKSNKLAK